MSRSRRGFDPAVKSRRVWLAGLACLPLALLACKPSAKAPSLAVGDLMPGIQLPGSQHETYAIAAGSGPLLLNFWATWCPPCRAEMAALDRIHRVLAAKGLGVHCISVDEDVFLVQEFALKEKLSLPLLFDRGGEVARKVFRVAAYPTSFLVDKRGFIVEIWMGERDWDSGPVRARLEQLLQ